MDSSTSSCSSLSSTGSSQPGDKRKPRLSTNGRISEALKTLRDGRISPFDMFLKLLDPSEEEFSGYRNSFYTVPKGSEISKLDKLLDQILADPHGRTRILQWMEPHAISFVLDKVSAEMDDIKVSFRGTMDAITPDFLAAWDVNSMVSKTVEHCAPVLRSILHVAAQTERAKEKNKIKHCDTVSVLFECAIHF